MGAPSPPRLMSVMVFHFGLEVKHTSCRGQHDRVKGGRGSGLLELAEADMAPGQSYSAEALVALARRRASTVPPRSSAPSAAPRSVVLCVGMQRSRGRKGTRRNRPGTPHPVNPVHPVKELNDLFGLFVFHPPRKTLVSPPKGAVSNQPSAVSVLQDHVSRCPGNGWSPITEG